MVDGHSTDKTLEVVADLSPKAKVILQDRHGKGNALSCGFNAATGDIIVMVDADGSADPAEIPRFLEALKGGAEFAKGSRYLSGGGSADISLIRSVGNRSLAKLVNLLYGSSFTDLCYGYNAFWRHTLPVIHRDSDGFEVETVLNARAARDRRLRVVEVPSFEHRRIHGFSNLNAVRDGLRVLWTIARERMTPRSALPDRDEPPESWYEASEKGSANFADPAQDPPLTESDNGLSSSDRRSEDKRSAISFSVRSTPSVTASEGRAA